MHEDTEDFLAHFGVKGMRWGKRKAGDSGSDSVSSSNKASTKTEAKATKQLGKDQKKYDKNVRRNGWKAQNEASKHVEENVLPKLNKKYGDLDFSKADSDPKVKKAQEKYFDEFEKSYEKALSTKVSEMFGDRPE